MKFVLKKSCQQLRIFRVAPFAHRLTSLGRTVLRHNRIDGICPEKIVPTAVHFSCRSFCAPLDKSWAHSFSAQSRWCNLSWKNRANSCAPFVSLLLRTAWQVLGAQYFGTIALMQFVLKNPCQQLCSFSLAPRQRSYACPIAQCLHTAWQVLGIITVFRHIRTDGICPKNPQQLYILTISLPPNWALCSELSIWLYVVIIMHWFHSKSLG